MAKSDDWWVEELTRLERRLRALRGVRSGEMRVYEVPRTGYTERRIRHVRNHTIKLIRPLDWTPPRKRRKR